ncbi:glycosyltransferase [Phycicoccus duodecadis]|uniref:D-inositol 3-phosphate glycosyltransferase n=1 Tax=Phycicoccus duodecadis TaxID=173053 RepID=A0A2N3YEW5_9MICO|nr:glycosyltransferase [Phycicoccus duodecadis]PKW25397.1 HEAT repeat protein [Phycicoccus duodecadis]
MHVGAALSAVRSSGSILEGLRAGQRLEELARRGDAAAVDLLVAATSDPDAITAVAAVRALGAQGSAAAASRLVALLDDPRADVAEHAVEALAGVAPPRDAVAPLVQRCAAGGFTGMLAQRTLETWAAATPSTVLDGLVAELAAEHDPGARARLIETVGLLPKSGGLPILTRASLDDAETPAVRAAALSALGDLLADRSGHGTTEAPAVRAARAALAAVAATSGPLARVADRARADAQPPADRRPRATGRSDGLTVVQLFLHGAVDGSLRHSGRGDTGGIATLLVQLGDALLRQESRVGRVITVSGGWGDLSTPAAPDPTEPDGHPDDLRGPGHHYVQVPFREASTGLAAAWSRWVEARRGLRRILRAAGSVDVVHLRMADVGSMVAAEVATELGIPVVLTMAPDPQALVAAREADGSLTRAGFGAADVVEHLWFRDRLVRRLAEQAEHLVLFPRPDLEGSIARLVGVDLSAHPERVLVVGEGIDVGALDQVAREVWGDAPRSPATGAALGELDALLDRLPPERRSLPLAVSVGRLAPVKGMATLVGSWLADPALRDRCNLLLIGGELDDPSREERAELDRIHDLLASDTSAGAGVLLAGHRPNATATAWLAAAQRGTPAAAGPGGVYVCASLKEEFGIAILEAMTVGLVVVTPDGGGPATYVDDGVTGVRTDTTRQDALSGAVRRALDLAAAPGAGLRRRRSRAVVRERFGIHTMAAAVAEVYTEVASAHRGPGRMVATP